MKVSNGYVTVNELPTKNRLFKFCEKKIDQWLQSRSDLEPLEGPVEFSVSFTEDDESSQVSCQTEIQLGAHIYRGCDLAPDTQQAFMHSLKRLHAAH